MTATAAGVGTLGIAYGTGRMVDRGRPDERLGSLALNASIWRRNR